jgi:hypothetical protein
LLKNKFFQIIIILLAGLGLIWGINTILLMSVTGQPIQTNDPLDSIPLLDNEKTDISSICGLSGSKEILMIYHQPERPLIFQYIYLDFDFPALSIITIPNEIKIKTQLVGSDQEDKTLLEVYEQLIHEQEGNDNQKTIVAALLAQTLYENFNLSPENYVMLDQHAYKDIVNILGGIQMDLPYPMIIPETTITLEAGENIITGEAAYQLALIASEDTRETIRKDMERQMLLFRGITEQIDANGGTFLTTEIYDSLHHLMTTDIQIHTFNSLICFINHIPNQSINLSAPEPEWFDSNLTRPGG